jgi:hypothetical protein
MGPLDVVRVRLPLALNVPSMGPMEVVTWASVATRDCGVSDHIWTAERILTWILIGPRDVLIVALPAYKD